MQKLQRIEPGANNANNINSANIKHNLPEKKYRAGAICATIWKNASQKDGKEFEYRTVSFERSFQNEKGEWAQTNSLRANDLPKAVLVLQKAFEYISLTGNDEELVV